MPVPGGQSCATCQFLMTGTISNKLECRHTSPDTHAPPAQAIWPHVLNEDWCGDWRLAGPSPDCTIGGAVVLANMTPALLLDTAKDPVYTVAALRGLQATHTGNQTRVLQLLTAETGGTVLLTLTLNPASTVTYTFNPPINSATGQIYAALTTVPNSPAYVSAQGTKEAP